jgi:hypothetical protein
LGRREQILGDEGASHRAAKSASIRPGEASRHPPERNTQEVIRRFHKEKAPKRNHYYACCLNLFNPDFAEHTIYGFTPQILDPGPEKLLDI